MRQDYGAVIAQVFPQAVHHVCLFHALQDVQQHIKDVYGADYAAQYPEAEDLKQQIYAIFDAHTLARATKRYTDVLALRQAYISTQPQAARIFDFLERHWPKLANSIGVSTIPATNNTVELVIRRFDQHYQPVLAGQARELLRFRVAHRCSTLPGRLREDLPLHPLLPRRPTPHPGQVAVAVSGL